MEGPRAAYRGGVPDKRQTSKQKRASRNRAQREALAARRENASAPARSAVTSSPSGSSEGGGTRAGSSRAAAVAAPSGPRPSGLDAFRRENRRPGDVAVMISLVLAVVGFILVLRYQVPTDDRGDAIPVQFGGLALAARGVLTGTEITKGHESLLSMYGPGILAMLAIPVVVVAVVLFLNMRMEQRSRVLTIGMVAVAGVVFLTGLFGIYYLAALVSLAVASFQVRKVELPQRQADMAARREARAAGRGRGRGAIDVEEVDPEAEDGAGPDDAPVATERERRPRRSRAARRATTAEAEVVEPEPEPEDGVDEVDEPAAPAEPQAQAAPSDDDILAELEEELRRESEADDEDGPTGRTR